MDASCASSFRTRASTRVRPRRHVVRVEHVYVLLPCIDTSYSWSSEWATFSLECGCWVGSVRVCLIDYLGVGRTNSQLQFPERNLISHSVTPSPATLLSSRLARPRRCLVGWNGDMVRDVGGDGDGADTILEH